jgi:transposase InsO family protein
MSVEVGSERKKETRTCHYCKKAGHLKRECRKRMRDEKEKKEGSGQEKANEGTSERKEVVASISEPEDDWANAVLVNDEPMEHDIISCLPELALLTDGSAEAVTTARRVLLDSGSTRHLSPHRSDFTNFRNIPPKPLITASQTTFYAIGEGDVQIEIPLARGTSTLLLKGVLYTPEVAYTIVSVGCLASAGYKTSFQDRKCQIFSCNGDLAGEISQASGNTYRYEYVACLETAEAMATEPISLMDLHSRLGHISPHTVARLAKGGELMGVKLADTTVHDCESCLYGRAKRAAISPKRLGPRSKNLGDKIHSDVWGPADTRSINGHRYYVSFIDDATRHSTIYLLRTKDEVFTAYKKYEAYLSTQHGANIKSLHSDRGGEYTSQVMREYLESKGTRQLLTVHDTPEHNGIAEYLNRRVLERVRAMLHESNLPAFLWSEAARHAIYLINRTPTTSTHLGAPCSSTPQESRNSQGEPEKPPGLVPTPPQMATVSISMNLDQ